MNSKIRIIAMVLSVMLPTTVMAQEVGGPIHSMQGVLDQLYESMIPLCSRLIGVGRGIAGFAATWYIAARVWKHIARAEAIDFYPLFRPFVIGFAVLVFPSVIAMINGVMQPVVSATAGMVDGSDQAIATLLKMKEAAIRKTISWQMYSGDSGEGDRDRWYQYTFNEDPDEEGMLEGVSNSVRFAMSKLYYNTKNSIKEWLSEILRVLYEAAALCINTIRTFHLIVLSILGPLVFGLSVFDGFRHTLTVWIARYINFFLWLPVANIFGAMLGTIQENMLRLDISQLQQQGATFFSATDMGYMIFLIIGIAGYFSVPGVANYIIHAGGGDSLLHRVSQSFGRSSVATASAVTSGTASMVRDVYGDARHHMESGYMDKTSDYFKNKISGQ